MPEHDEEPEMVTPRFWRAVGNLWRNWRSLWIGR